MLFCGVVLAIVQKITEPTQLCILGRRTFNSRLSVRRRLQRRHRSGGSGERVNDRDFNSANRIKQVPARFSDRYEWHLVYPVLYKKFSYDDPRETS